MKTEKEYIICAAIWFHDDIKHDHQPFNIDLGFVVCGHRHHNCYMTVSLLSKEDIRTIVFHHDTQGFVTNTNRFVNRQEAWHIALKAGQLDESTKNLPKSLFSEDLY